MGNVCRKPFHFYAMLVCRRWSMCVLYGRWQQQQLGRPMHRPVLCTADDSLTAAAAAWWWLNNARRFRILTLTLWGCKPVIRAVTSSLAGTRTPVGLLSASLCRYWFRRFWTNIVNAVVVVCELHLVIMSGKFYCALYNATSLYISIFNFTFISYLQLRYRL